MKKMTEIRNDLISLIDEDAAVFEPLSKAYGLPKETPEQAEEKERIMEKCLKDAASVPVRILDDAAQAVLLLEEFAEKGSKLAVSDAGCGASLCRSAMEGAALNVYHQYENDERPCIRGKAQPACEECAGRIYPEGGNGI
jgi:formiminotetrahydrofolate cyclodeaminase